MVLYGVWRFAIELETTSAARRRAFHLPPISIFLVIGGIALLVLVKTGVLKKTVLDLPPAEEEPSKKKKTKKHPPPNRKQSRTKQRRMQKKAGRKRISDKTNKNRRRIPAVLLYRLYYR
ncbi:MAG: hypothetical protein R2912_05195 [Eubacteriales bacterium]